MFDLGIVEIFVLFDAAGGRRARRRLPDRHGAWRGRPRPAGGSGAPAPDRYLGARGRCGARHRAGGQRRDAGGGAAGAAVGHGRHRLRGAVAGGGDVPAAVGSRAVDGAQPARARQRGPARVAAAVWRPGRPRPRSLRGRRADGRRWATDRLRARQRRRSGRSRTPVSGYVVPQFPLSRSPAWWPGACAGRRSRVRPSRPTWRPTQYCAAPAAGGCCAGSPGACSRPPPVTC